MKLIRAIKNDLAYMGLLSRVAMEFKAESVAVSLLTLVLSIFNGIGISFVIPLFQNIQKSDTEPFFVFRRLGIEFADRRTEMLVILGIILVSMLLASLLTYLCQIMSVVLQEKVIIRLRTKILESTYRSSYRFFIDREVGELSNVFILQTRQHGNAVFTLIQFAMNLCLTVMYAVLMLAISVQWTAAVVLIYVLITIIVQLVVRRIHYFNSINITTNEKISGNYVNDILGVKLIKIFNMRDTMFGRYAGQFRDVFNAVLSSQKRVLFVQPFMEAFSMVVIVGFVMAYIVTDATGFYDTLPFIAGYFAVMQKMKTSLFNVNHHRAHLQRLKKATLNVQAVLADDSYNEKKATKPFTGFNNDIEFRNVGFEYEQGKPVLDDVSFRIRRGEMVAIVGPSGSGKTTISDLILKFVEPVSGAIEVDGKNLSDIDTASYYKEIGLVLQESFLFNNTIHWNIARGETETYDIEKIKRAAKYAGIDSFIETLDGGYEALVGDRGGRLSGGEKQRISIARALVHDPAIIVMDEPTSALDGYNEKIVMDSINSIRKDRTVVLITHKMSTARQADRIVLLRNGRVAGDGTHEELLAASDYYRNLQEED